MFAIPSGLLTGRRGAGGAARRSCAEGQGSQAAARVLAYGLSYDLRALRPRILG